MCAASNLEQPKETQCFCFPRASILDPSYTYVDKVSPPSLVLFEIRILKMMISEVATEGRTRPILYLCKQGVASLFSSFEMNIFKMRLAGPGAHVLKGPARRILKMFIS